jgi:hypothetical protein
MNYPVVLVDFTVYGRISAEVMDTFSISPKSHRICQKLINQCGVLPKGFAVVLSGIFN